MKKRIALLATGDEIINGDILNTNTQAFASRLFTHGMQPGLQLTASDTQAEIEAAIKFLLQEHDALIISGGLGPTSDDRTRFALAEVLQTPLIFNSESWGRITARFEKYHIKGQPDSNRQQCLFPEGAEVLINEHGTADGCQIIYQQKLIFMLPGPPRECLPLFMTHVVPRLETADFASHRIHRKWLLLGVSEGALADKLDQIAENYDVTTGYRVHMPYVEFKLHASDPKVLDAFWEEAKAEVLPFHVNRENEIASDLLKACLIKTQTSLKIEDYATKGLFVAKLMSPKTHLLLNQAEAQHCFTLSGLDEIWQESDTETTTLVINNKPFTLNNRQGRTLIHAIEIISQFIYNAVFQ